MLDFLKDAIRLIFNFSYPLITIRPVRQHNLKAKFINGCFAGSYFILAGLDRRYKFLFMTDRTAPFLPSCVEIPEITSWCIENDCIYGWALHIHNSNGAVIFNNDDGYTLFIATNKENSYILAKLTW